MGKKGRLSLQSRALGRDSATHGGMEGSLILIPHPLGMGGADLRPGPGGRPPGGLFRGGQGSPREPAGQSPWCSGQRRPSGRTPAAAPPLLQALFSPPAAPEV